MSKNLKCPVCQKGTIMFKENLSCECSQCRFQCHHGQIERIAAAMELAKAEVAASNAVWSVPLARLEPAVEAAEDMLFQAKMRVLEVFK